MGRRFPSIGGRGFVVLDLCGKGPGGDKTLADPAAADDWIRDIRETLELSPVCLPPHEVDNPQLSCSQLPGHRTIRKRQATFLGHVMRRGKLEHLVRTGKFEGKRSRGRQREKIMDGLATWLGTGKVLDTLAAVKDRDLWRDMIANAYKQGT
ncbi:UDP-glucuronosyltransferase 2a1-like [Plakobranchus ocellatus]|uniref:UDP-glucuronosyltransferase 2a1-like n=1 Tax=Plakobranchus ocellatus TaxID=259542 RepID=A0AAV3YV33_9GAST|nr:UDP-glucuronosyltransferase 2a1-like [Plakobranchus ocellatus]